MVSVPELSGNPRQLLLGCSIAPPHAERDGGVILAMLEGGTAVVDFREIATGNTFVQVRVASTAQLTTQRSRRLLCCRAGRAR